MMHTYILSRGWRLKGQKWEKTYFRTARQFKYDFVGWFCCYQCSTLFKCDSYFSAEAFLITLNCPRFCFYYVLFSFNFSHVTPVAGWILRKDIFKSKSASSILQALSYRFCPLQLINPSKLVIFKKSKSRIALLVHDAWGLFANGS